MKSKINELKTAIKYYGSKNFLLTCMASFLFIVSCTNTKMIADNEKMMRGDWTITDVSVDGIQESQVDITVFDEAKSQCFEGSTWHLVQNNASGNYTLQGGTDCPSATTKIKWFITETDGQYYFNFKKIYEGERPKNVVDGYKMRVASNTGSSIVLEQELTFEGKPLSVFYTFNKNQ
ncbi:MAG TPA: hypothetical protein VKY36_05355 [Moheibacter sp.]|nr:hypothetical protein [Moheibacter sp.]